MIYVCELDNIIQMIQISRPSLSQQFGIKLKDSESEDCFAVFQKGRTLYCCFLHIVQKCMNGSQILRNYKCSAFN
jgi:hypothetical protein